MFQAQVTIDYLNAKPYLAEKTFGWDRRTVVLGLNELHSGMICVDNFKARGNKKSEEKYPQLEADIVSLASDDILIYTHHGQGQGHAQSTNGRQRLERREPAV